MKRLLSVVLCALLLVGLIPAASLTAYADIEGDWTIYRTPESYEAEAEGEIVKPAPGYKYTAEGFTTIAPDWTNYTPFFTVQTKEAQPLKNGIYLEFRVDDYPYGGEDGGADHWLSFSLSDRPNVYPGNVDFGNNWLCLIRGAGNGSAAVQSCITTQTTDEDIGTFKFVGDTVPTISMDADGREIYTLEITWDGSAYDIKVCGVSVKGIADITTALKNWNASGEFYVGITAHAGIKGESAGITVTKFGTSASNATVPAGTDFKNPETEYDFQDDPLIPSDTVPADQPAILWNPETVTMENGANCTFTPQRDNTWRVKATDTSMFFSFTAERDKSYAAEDFPVFGIMLRNFWLDSGTLLYDAAGYDSDRPNGWTVPFVIYDGEFYGAEEEYVFIPVDLTDLWEGRINSVGVELFIADETVREFDVCFAGMFRSKDEAYAYANEWLSSCEGYYPETPAPATEPPYDLPASSQPPEIWDTIPEEVITEIVSSLEADSLDYEQAVEDILAKYGCAGSVGGLVLLLPLAVAVALKKKE